MIDSVQENATILGAELPNVVANLDCCSPDEIILLFLGGANMDEDIVNSVSIILFNELNFDMYDDLYVENRSRRLWKKISVLSVGPLWYGSGLMPGLVMMC